MGPSVRLGVLPSDHRVARKRGLCAVREGLGARESARALFALCMHAFEQGMGTEPSKVVAMLAS
jgi:hypothetical protein